MDPRNRKTLFCRQGKLRLADQENISLQIVDQLHLAVEQGVLESYLAEHQEHRESDAGYRDREPTPVVRQVLPSQGCFAESMHCELE